MKKARQQQTPAAVPEFKVNPFAKLKVKAPDGTKASAPGAAMPKAPGKAGPLSRDDAALRSALLKQAGGQQLKLRFLKHGRGGRPTTVLRGFAGFDIPAMMEFGAALEKDLGLRGTWQEREFEIDGDHVQRLVPWLQQHGFRVMVNG